ncbi:MAG TPA: hypothetical protein VL172_05680, partial [Kofleriaceae bacterium]|nr:hypothetical protein [Kofleriaceae bacterium]
MSGCTLALLALTALIGAPGPAAARGLERFQFDVNARTGKVKQTWTASGAAANTTRPTPPRTRAPAAVPPKSMTAAYEQPDIVVRDASGAEVRRVPMVRTAYEFMSWHVFVGDVFLFAWRVPTGKPAPDDYHDVWNAIEVSTGNQLWQREVPWHDPPGVHALGKDLVLIDDWQRV